MKKQPVTQNTTSFVYKLEVMVTDTHHTTALEQLIKKLNEANFADYRIESGIQLGHLIDEAMQEQPDKIAVPTEIIATNQPEPPQEVADIFTDVKRYLNNNTLIRLVLNKGLGIKKSIPCRVMRVDEELQLITVYHVDEKQVYTFNLYEVEEIFV